MIIILVLSLFAVGAALLLTRRLPPLSRAVIAAIVFVLFNAPILYVLVLGDRAQPGARTVDVTDIE